MVAYYNEIDPYAAEWLGNLIHARHIARGKVDTRSIVDVAPDDLRGFTQCHFFAGVGVWSYALRLAAWPDCEPIWTGSCPCQPFSAAGKGAGFDDERHLWPAFHWLIDQCRPETILGEQVASTDGLAWLDLVHADLENTGYTFGAVDTCSAGFGAPHIRQRLVFGAYRDRLEHAPSVGREQRRPEPVGWGIACGRRAGGLGDTVHAERREVGVNRQDGRDWADSGRAQAHGLVRTSGEIHRLADTDQDRREPGFEIRRVRPEHDVEHGRATRLERPGPVNGFWAAADWLHCRDERWRPVEPGAFPLAHGASARVGRLRAYGNAINAQATAEIITAFMECCP